MHRSFAPAATLAAGLLFLTPTASAQEAPAASDELDPAELERLREEAAAELSGGPAPAGDAESALRRDAAVAAEEGDDALYDQLLEAFSSIAERANAFNPRITAFGDFLGRLALGKHERVETIDGTDYNLDDRISLREAELDFRADVDPFAKALLIVALEEEIPGEYAVDIEEGYVTFEALPWGLRAQAGKFRVPVGQANRLHTHDIPQATRPYAAQDVFGEEGYLEQGALASWLTPWIPLELWAGILNGENERLFAGGQSDDPAWFGRGELFLQLTDDLSVSGGGSFLFGYADAPAPDQAGPPHLESQLWQADLMLRWQPSNRFSVVAQGELYGLKKEIGTGGDREHAFGGYAQLQVQVLQNLYVGCRYDWSNYGEGIAKNEHQVLGAWVSYYTTEFLRLRVGYEHHERHTTGGGEPDLDTLFFQITFVFGSHPTEPFWVNR